MKAKTCKGCDDFKARNWSMSCAKCVRNPYHADYWTCTTASVSIVTRNKRKGKG